MGIITYNFWEHKSEKYLKNEFPKEVKLISKTFGKSSNRFAYEIITNDDYHKITAGYFIGIDWLAEGHSSIVVAPKLNTRVSDIKEFSQINENVELDENGILDNSQGLLIDIDYLSLLRECLKNNRLYNELDDLLHIDWHASEIPISFDVDWLSPFIVIKYLNTLKTIARKGLKKSYYKTIQNLNSKVKGKILIGKTIKNNVVKNRFTTNFCQFDEFGVDSIENRLLKSAMIFAQSYLDNYAKAFGNELNYLNSIISFCRPAFELVNNDIDISDVKHFKLNPFFKEYTEAINLAKLILKRFSYSLSNTSKEIITTPPYWIDMPKLFELYIFSFLQIKFPNKIKEVKYHFSTYGNELDFLINSDRTKMVVDAKYKALYIYGVDHSDIRQVSGYSRLNKVYDELEITYNSLIDCLIIYPDVNNGLTPEEFLKLDFNALPSINTYKNIYKVGIRLPQKKVNTL